jgi:hypothetical protein
LFRRAFSACLITLKGYRDLCTTIGRLPA